MPEISQTRLRAVFRDAETAHSALMAINDKVRAARRDLQAAEETLRLHNETRHLHQAAMKSRPNPAGKGWISEPMDPDPGRHTRAREAAVVKAKGLLDALLVEQERALEKWELASSLRASAKEFAVQHGQLPDDLKDH